MQKGDLLVCEHVQSLGVELLLPLLQNLQLVLGEDEETEVPHFVEYFQGDTLLVDLLVDLVHFVERTQFLLFLHRLALSFQGLDFGGEFGVGVEVELEVLEELLKGEELLVEDANLLGEIVEELLQVKVGECLDADLQTLVFGGLLGEGNDHFLQKLSQLFHAFVLKVLLVLVAELPQMVVELEVRFYFLLEVRQAQQVLLSQLLLHVLWKQNGVLLVDLRQRWLLSSYLLPNLPLHYLGTEEVVEAAEIEAPLVSYEIVQEVGNVVHSEGERLVVEFIQE